MDAVKSRPCPCFDQVGSCGPCPASMAKTDNTVTATYWVLLRGCLSFTYLCDEVLGIGRDFDAVLSFLRPANWRVLNQIVHLVLIWIVKWRDANNHLVYQDAKRPPIERLVVTWPYDHLWRQILGRSTEWVGLFCVRLHDLGETEVCQHDVAVIV